MQYSYLGNTGLQVSRICLGMMSYGSASYQGWVLPAEDGHRHVKLALEAGVNFFDTADFYSKGMSESILGDAISQHARRDDVVIATKIGLALEPGVNRDGLSRKYVFSAAEASLRRLKTDYIDLFMMHHTDFHTPFDETLSALEDLVRAGKVRYIGASNHPAWYLARAHYIGQHKYNLKMDSTQIQYNLAYREEERETIPFCQSEGVGMTVYSPLARGLLAGNRVAAAAMTEREKIRSETDMKAKATYGTEADMRIVKRVSEVAKARGVSDSQVAMAWLLGKSHINSITCGVLEDAHLKNAVDACDLILTGEETSSLEALYEPRAPMETHVPLKAGDQK
jgi:aryl-alcohol dehydrogenase-like predicted oxidoreductase